MGVAAVVVLKFACLWTDTKKDRHTDMLITILCYSTGGGME